MPLQIKRYAILILAMLLLARVLSCRLVDYKPADFPQRCPDVPAAEQISAEEMEKFLKTWSEYMQKGLNKEIADQVSLMESHPSAKVPWKINFFLNRECWDTDRFYYVEQRVRSIIHTHYLKAHTSEVAAVLKKELASEQDPAKKAAYQEMIAMQDKIANIEGIGADELKLVSGREETVERILNGQEKYK